MHLVTFGHVLRERWKIAVGVLVLFVLIAIAAIVLTPKTYTAQAQVLVTARSDGNAAGQAQANSYVQTQVLGYAKLIDSPAVIDYVAAHAHAGLSASQIEKAVSATAVAGQSIVTVTATDSDAGRSAAIATSAARGFARTVEGYDSSTRVLVTDPASTPGSPTTPRPALDIVLGVLVGLIAGAAAVQVRQMMDRRIREPELAAAAAGAVVAGVVVEDPATSRQPIASVADRRPERLESFRQIRAAVQFAFEDGGRVLAVTGPVRGVGVTNVAVNLAVALAEAGADVTLVDAQLRRPAVAAAFGLSDDAGLSDVLARGVPLQEVVRTASAGLRVVTAGATLSAAAALLGSPAMSAVLSSLAASSDYVVVDAGPLLAVADGAATARFADATLLVARYGSTTEAEVVDASDALRRVGRVASGIVLNRTPRRRGPTSRGRRLRGAAIAHTAHAGEIAAYRTGRHASGDIRAGAQNVI